MGSIDKIRADVAGSLPWWHSQVMSGFTGSIEDLKAGVAVTGIDGSWEEKPNKCWKFTSKDRAGMNWSQTRGTLWFDGPDQPKKDLMVAVDAIIGAGVAKAEEGRTIFVVHGHDTEVREQLELVLHRLGLKPYVLQNTDGGGADNY